MKMEIKKLTKKEREHIENKMLTVFAVALGAVMVLMYLLNWLNGSMGFRNAAKTIIYIGIVAFIALAVFCKIKASKFKKENVADKANKYNNWFIFSIVAAVVSFLTFPNDIIRFIIGENAWNNFYLYWDKFRFFGQNSSTGTMIITLMILIGIYTLCVFIYYGIYLHRCRKSTLNKGKK